MMADRGDCAAMPGAPAPRAVEIVIGDDPSRWAAIGFALAGGAARVGEVRIVAAGGAPGLRAVHVAGLRADRPDGLAILAADDAPGAPAPARHPNGALAVDHVVALTDDAGRTSAALAAAGLPLRRVRRPPESPVVQAFHPAGTLVIEVVQAPGRAPSLWGLVVSVADLAAAAALLGDRLGAARDAVQPGRRIATIRDAAGLSTALALMTPREDSNPPDARSGLDGRTPIR
jgi:hypothetical protein